MDDRRRVSLNRQQSFTHMKPRAMGIKTFMEEARDSGITLGATADCAHAIAIDL